MFISACDVDDCLTCDTTAAICDECEPGFVLIGSTECRGNSHTCTPTHPHTHTQI